jgi:alpha-beta hydrolase superfamily lysophospholipase
MLLAAREKLVDNKAAVQIATRLPDCRTHIISAAAHELLREAEPQRQDALDRIAAFAKEVIS